MIDIGFIQKAIEQYGILGGVAVVFALVIRFLYSDCRRREDEQRREMSAIIHVKDMEIKEVNGDRVRELRELTSALVEVRDALHNVCESYETMSERMDSLERRMKCQ